MCKWTCAIQRVNCTSWLRATPQLQGWTPSLAKPYLGHRDWFKMGTWPSQANQVLGSLCQGLLRKKLPDLRMLPTTWVVLCSSCLDHSRALGAAGAHLAVLRTARLRMAQAEERWKGTGSLVLLSHWIKPCLKPDQYLDFQVAEITNFLHL